MLASSSLLAAATVGQYGATSVAEAAPGQIPLDGLWATEVSLGDLGKGRADDVVVANEGGSTITVLAAKRNGGHRAPVRYQVGLAPSNVQIADVNGDGHNDVVAMDAGGSTLAVLRGDGTGRLSKAVHSPTATVATAAFALADFNDDGKVDAAVSNPTGAVAVNFGRGDGSFGRTMTYPGPAGGIGLAAADFDGDGDVDVVSGGAADDRAVVLRNKGDGTFAKASTRVGIGTTCTKTADVDGDRTPDIVSALAPGSLSIAKGRGDGTFAAPRSHPTGGFWASCMGIEDFNGDAKPDMALANMGSFSVAILTNRGRGNFSRPHVVNVGDWVITCNTGDITGDGRPDVVCPVGTVPSLIVLDGRGGGRFSAPHRISLT